MANKKHHHILLLYALTSPWHKTVHKKVIRYTHKRLLGLHNTLRDLNVVVSFLRIKLIV